MYNVHDACDLKDVVEKTDGHGGWGVGGFLYGQTLYHPYSIYPVIGVVSFTTDVISSVLTVKRIFFSYFCSPGPPKNVK